MNIYITTKISLALSLTAAIQAFFREIMLPKNQILF
jgi:hypothetical protein